MSKYMNISENYGANGEVVTIETYKSLNIDGDPGNLFVEKEGAIYERFVDENGAQFGEEKIAVEIPLTLGALAQEG